MKVSFTGLALGDRSSNSLTANAVDARDIERVNYIYTSIRLSGPRSGWFAFVSVPSFSRFAMTPPGLLLRAQLLAGD